MSIVVSQILYAYEGETGEDVVASLDFWSEIRGSGGGGGGGLQNGNGNGFQQVDRVGVMARQGGAKSICL